MKNNIPTELEHVLPIKLTNKNHTLSINSRLIEENYCFYFNALFVC